MTAAEPARGSSPVSGNADAPLHAWRTHDGDAPEFTGAGTADVVTTSVFSEGAPGLSAEAPRLQGCGTLKSKVFRQQRVVAERFAFHARRIPALRPYLVERFAADLRDLHDALERTELRGHYWVWGGLLLGWAREGAILSHDSLDADFAVTDRDFHRLVSAVPTIVKAGFKCDRRLISNDGHVTEVTFMRHGARFEFFRMFPQAGRLRYFMYSLTPSEAIELEAYLPEQAMVPFSFIGRTWLKHEDHELELRSMYGTWEIPDPSWSYLEGPDIEVRRAWHRPGYDWRGGAAALTGDSSQPTPGN